MPKNTLKRNEWEERGIARNHTHGEGFGEAPIDKFQNVIEPLQNMDIDMLNYWIGKFVLEVRYWRSIRLQ